MNTVYVIVALCVVIMILGVLLMRGTKTNAKLENENKNATGVDKIQKKELDVAATSVTPEEAYAGLKAKPKDK